jgi:predicted kinase
MGGGTWTSDPIDALTRAEIRRSRGAERALDLDDELCTLSVAINNRSITDIKLENVLYRLQERVENGSASVEQAVAVRRAHRLLARMDKLAHRLVAEMGSVA